METLKTRKIRLSSMPDDERDMIVQQLALVDGIKDVRYKSNSNDLVMTYDLESIMLKRIEQILEEQGVDLDAGLGQKIKRNWQHFTEQNELDNLRVNPTCCSNPKETLDKAHHV